MLCEKSRIIKARSPPARILEILSFSKFNREDNFFADNQVHICGRHDKRNRGNGRILHAIRRTGATGKAQPLERNAAAYLIGKLKRKRDRFCKSCRRSSFRSHTTRGRKANTSRIAVFPCCFFLIATPHCFLSIRETSGKRSLWKRSPVGAVLCARMRPAARQRAF